MKRIKTISELKPGDIIWRIKNNIELQEIEFLCIHPHNENYSLFMDMNKDGLPKFYNERLETEVWYLYDDKNSRKDFLAERIKVLKVRLKNLEIRKKDENRNKI